MTALPKDLRLIKRSDFSNIYKSGANAYKTKHFTFLVKPNRVGNARIAVVIRKKIIKKAVFRNYIRRVANTLFVNENENLGSVDIIAILTRPIELNFNMIKLDWYKFLEKATLREKF
ncbi:MAG: ribonuclease P protein component [Gammaproteobacteria bacterium]|nr:ribonuclease P protein component [Gammaproteobacteria bacterium]